MKFNRAIKAFKTIESASDLKKHKLSLADYQDLAMTLQSIVDVGTGTTLIKSVADWCKRNGLAVTEESICYSISKQIEHSM